MADEEKIIVSVEYDTREAEKNVESLTASIVNLEDQNRDLATQQKAIQKELRKTDGELQKEGKTRRELSKQLTSNAQAIEVNKNFLQKEKKERKDSIKLISTEKGSRNQLTQTISKLIKERNALGTSTQEEIDKSEELRKRIDKLNEQLVEGSTVTEKNKLSVGGYTEAIKEALGETSLFGGAISTARGFQEKFNAIVSASGKAFQAQAQGVSTGTKALKLFKIALISTGIGAIVVALGLLIAAFSKFEPVVDAVSIALKQIGSVIQVIVGRIIRLKEAFGKLLGGDIQGALKATGEAFAGMGDEIKKTFKEVGAIEKLRIEIEKLNISTTTTLASLEKQTAIFQAIAGDSTRSFKELAEANENARKTEEATAKIRVELAEKNLELITRENDLKREQNQLTREEAKTEADAQAAVIKAHEEAQVAFIENEKERRQIVQDRLEKDLDILIDGFDNTKTINDRIVDNDKENIGKRIEALGIVENESQKSYDKQLEIIEQFAGKAIDAQSLLDETNAVSLNERIRALGLSEIIEGRLLEIIRERRIVEAELVESQKTINQGLTDLNAQLLTDLEANEEAFLESQGEFLDQEIEQTTVALEAQTDARVAQADKELEIEQNKANRRRDIIASSFAVAQDLAQSFFALQNATRDAQERRELEAAGENENKKEAIRKKFSKQKKKDAIKQAFINTALAIGNALATVIPFYPNALLAAGVAGVKGGLEVATIKKQQFGKGGQVPIAKNGASFGTFSGPSHAGGGIDLFTGTGEHVANVEGRENFYVVKKEASDYINSLSDINQRFGGVPLQGSKTFKMQDGGTVSPAAATQDVSEITRQVAASLPPIVVQVQDIKTGISDVDNVTNVGVI